MVAGLAVIFALALVAAPAAAESGVLTLTGSGATPVATWNLAAGDVVEWTYSSGGSVEFSIDLTSGGNVYSTSTMVGTGTFTAPSSGEYTFSFRNTGGSLTIVSYDIKKRFDSSSLLLIIGAIGAIAAVAIVAAALVYRKRKRAAPVAPQPYPQQYPQPYSQQYAQQYPPQTPPETPPQSPPSPPQ